MLIHEFRERKKERNQQTNKQTNKQREREREKEKEIGVIKRIVMIASFN